MQAMWMIGTNLMEMGNSAKAQMFVELNMFQCQLCY